MTSTCGLRIALSVRCVSSARGWRRDDVDRRDDDVEPGEQVVLVVEPAVGADLELAAVEQAEALGRRLGRRGAGRLLGREAGVERGDDLGAARRPGRGSGPRAIASDWVWSVRTW